MEDNKDKITNLLEEIDLKTSRSAELLNTYLLNLSLVEEDLKKTRQEITREVEILRGANQSISETINESVVNSLPILSSKMIEMLVPEISTKVEVSLENLRTVLKKTDRLFEEIPLYKGPSKSSSKNLFLIFFVSSLSLLSTGAIGYFFGKKTQPTMLFKQEKEDVLQRGKLFSFVYEKLSPHEKKRIDSLMGDAWKDYYKRMIN